MSKFDIFASVMRDVHQCMHNHCVGDTEIIKLAEGKDMCVVDVHICGYALSTDREIKGIDKEEIEYINQIATLSHLISVTKIKGIESYSKKGYKITKILTSCGMVKQHNIIHIDEIVMLLNDLEGILMKYEEQFGKHIRQPEQPGSAIVPKQ